MGENSLTHTGGHRDDLTGSETVDVLGGEEGGREGGRRGGEGEEGKGRR